MNLIYLDHIRRIRHALSRIRESRRRLWRKVIFWHLVARINNVTELLYGSRGTGYVPFFTGTLVKGKPHMAFNLQLEHYFAERFRIEIVNPILNVDTGGVYVEVDKEYKLATESTEWPIERRQILDESAPKNIEDILGSYARGITSSGYFHAVCEDIPEIIAIHKCLGSSVKFLQGWQLKSVANELFTVLGAKVVHRIGFVKVDRLNFISRGLDVGYLHPRNLEVLREFRDLIVNRKIEQGYSKIFVSRKSSRRLHPDEIRIQAQYEKKGFRVVEPHELSFSDQIRLFASSREVVGFHGAGLTNAVWSNHCKVIEYMPKETINRCYEWQSSICNHEYESIII